MHVVRRRHVHGVDVLVFLLEQFAPVLIDADLGEALLDPLEPPEVDIRNSHQIESRVFGERQQIAERLSGRADARVPHRGSRGARSNGQEGRDSRGRTDGLDEFSA